MDSPLSHATYFQWGPYVNKRMYDCILTSGLPRCESKRIAVQLSEIASDLGSRTNDLVTE